MSPAVTSLLTLAGVVTGNPQLVMWAVPAGAFAGSLTEEGVHLVSQAWRDRAEQGQEFADAVAEETGERIEEEFVEHSATDRKTRHLLGEAVTATMDSADEWKIRFGRSFKGRRTVRGSTTCECSSGFIGELEVADVRLLAIIAPTQTGGSKLAEGTDRRG